MGSFVTRMATETRLSTLAIGWWLVCLGSITSRASDDEVVLRESVLCGPNAALLYLTLNGIAVNDEQIDSIVCEAEGASMHELNRFINSMGISTQVRNFRLDEAYQMRLPAIWLTPKKHYLVVTGFDSEGIHAFDGTTGQQITIRKENLRKFFSGNAIVPASAVGFSLFELTTPLTYLMYLFLVGTVVVYAKRWVGRSSNVDAAKVQNRSMARRDNTQ